MEADEGRDSTGVPLVCAASRHGDRTAIVDVDGGTPYALLAQASARIASGLLVAADRAADRAGDLGGARVALLAVPGAGFVSALLGIWRAGGIVVPVAPSWPAPEIDRLLADCTPVAALCDARQRARFEGCDASVRPPIASVASLGSEAARALPEIDRERGALLVYTSGTTGRPKGVLTTHANIAAQVDVLLRAWGWRADDRILHVLPLHHVHGLINALACPLAAGATIEFATFDPAGVWERLASGEITVFMAVPTVYRRLLATWEAADASVRHRWAEGTTSLRLTVSGSAALPVDTLQRWEAVTGHRLLERYGMTEIGMALSNPLEGERRAGTVGQPLPGVEARLVDGEGLPVGEGVDGEIEVRGAQVFREYWGRPTETRAAFRDGWFRTGDVARVDDGYWRILGRADVDIIKSGGYKVSAVEIEEVLRAHAAVADAAVVGLPDPDWGERVCAAVETSPGTSPDPDGLREWCRARLAPYKVPRTVVPVAELPRNAMGKVRKAAVRELLARIEGAG